MERMGAVERIKPTKDISGLTLSEAESKKLLSRYGLPVVAETVVTSEEDAVAQSCVTRFPVVLKALGAKLTHKTERGLVKVNLKSAAEVRKAYRELKAAAGGDWEACLIQPLVQGRREFVAGLFRDPQFGPVVMFGLGGVYTEALRDVVFRIAPVSRKQAALMLKEIQGRALLGAYRGEAAADKEQLLDALVGLSRLGMENPEIKEVDINPLIVMPDGRVTAVDALVVYHEKEAIPVTDRKETHGHPVGRTKAVRAAIDAMAHAKSVAVVGARRPDGVGFAGMFGCMRNFGYPGRLYPINPNLAEIEGIKCYPNLAALPEKVDLVIISVPAPKVPDVFRECVATGNRNIHIFTSGFKESGEPDCIRLQEEMEQIAREGNLHVVGPNCMGFYVPKSGLCTWTAASKESGPVALISQSGGNAQDFTNYTTDRYGIHFSKSISFGNALTLDSTDYLDYLAHDDETRIITMYLEGVKDGRLLLDLVTAVNRRKPVIIYKGGLTESGARAVSSHTGSMAGGEKIWNAFFRQSGAVQVHSLEEMAEMVLAFHHVKEVPGRRTTVIGFGGGIGVYVADTCARAGLELPPLSEKLTRKLRKLIPPAGAMIRNPIDAVVAFINPPLLGEVMHLIAESGEIDNFIISVPFDWLYDKEPGGRYIQRIAEWLADEGRKHLGGKPMVVAWRQYEPSEKIRKWIPVLEETLLQAGVAVYEGLPRAVSSLAKLAVHHEFSSGHIPRPPRSA